MATKLLKLFLVCWLAGISEAAHWSYKHQGDWPGQCKGGNGQSPINLSEEGTQTPQYAPFVFDNYENKYKATVVNNGHTISVQLDNRENLPTLFGGGLSSKYVMDSLHFHWNSEHTIAGYRYPLEAHLVHRNVNYSDIAVAVKHKDGISVLGVLFDYSLDHDEKLQDFLTSVRDVRNSSAEKVAMTEIVIADFLPRDKGGYYRYQGSLTTPLCEEAVIWTVFTNTLPISKNQVKQFEATELEKKVHVKNFREIQDLNDRIVYLRKSPYRSYAQEKKPLLYVIVLLYIVILLL